MQRRHKAVTVASVVAKGCRSESHVAAAILFTGVKCTAWSRKMISVLNGSASTYMKAGIPLPYYIYTAPRKARSQSRGEIIFFILFCLFGRQKSPACSVTALFVCEGMMPTQSVFGEKREAERRKKGTSSIFLSENTNTNAVFASSSLHTVFHSLCVARPGQGVFCDSNFLLSCVTQCLAQQTRITLVINTINSTDLTKQSVWENQGLGNRIATLEF